MPAGHEVEAEVVGEVAPRPPRGRAGVPGAAVLAAEPLLFLRKKFDCEEGEVILLHYSIPLPTLILPYSPPISLQLKKKMLMLY